MAETLAELAVKITADTAQFQKGLGEAEKGFQGFSKEVSAGLKVVGGAFTALGAVGLKMVSSSLEMNAALKQTGITIGATGEEMQDLALSITNVTFPLDSVIKTFELLARAGVKNTDEMKASAKAFDALADATGTSAAIIAETLIPVFRAFGQALPTTSAELDKFTWLAKNTTVDISEFATVVQRLAPEMQAMGLSTTDAMIAVAGLEAKGITGRKAVAELAAAIELMTTGTAKVWEELAKASTAVEDAQNGVAKALQGVADAQKNATRIQETAGIALERNKTKLEDLQEVLKDTTISERKRADVTLEIKSLLLDQVGIQDRVTEANKKVTEATEGVTEATKALAKAQEEENRLREVASEGNRTLAETLGLTAEEVTKYTTQLNDATGVTDIYSAAANTQFSIMDKVKQAWSELTLKASGFLEPLEPILAGMTALGPIMIALSTTIVQSAISWGIHTGALIAHKVAALLGAAAMGIATAAQWAWNVAMTANPIGLIILAIVALIAIIILIAKNWDTVREKVVESWDKLVGFFGNLWENIIGVFKGAWGAISGFFENIFEAIGNFFITAWNKIIGFFGGVWNEIKGLFSGIGEAVWNAIMSAVNTAIGLINNIIAIINKLPFVNIDEIPKVGGGAVPGFQHGGIVTRPTLGLIGEAGPEAVIPLNEAGGMGGITINFTQPVFFDREDTMNKFVDMIRKGIQRQDRIRFGGAYSG